MKIVKTALAGRRNRGLSLNVRDCSMARPVGESDMQKNITKHLLVLILSIGILCSMTVKAEVSSYAGIFDTYTDVRNRYPNAKFEDLEPAWLTPGSRLVSISGSGLGGTIVIHFYDEEYDVKRKLASGDISQAEYSETMRVVSMLKESDSGVRATWVRYVPDNYISLSALTKLYGTPKMEISKSDSNKP